jgi:peptide/nickel transport system substrate-binding protein
MEEQAMSLKRALISALVTGVAAIATAAEIQFYDDELPSSLNPLYAASMVDFRAQELYFDRLYYTDPVTNELKSRLVYKWEVASTGQGNQAYSVRLYLNEGLKWHNGKKLTAKDICFTIDSMLDPRSTAERSMTFKEFFKGCTVEKELQAKVEFSQVFYNPTSKLNFAVLPSTEFNSTLILPDHIFSSRPVGSGPMKGAKGQRAATFNAHVVSSHHSPKIQKMKMLPSGDPRIQVVDVQNGKMHGIISVPPPFRPQMRASSEVGMKNYDLRSWWFMAVNTNSPALQIKEVRQAINYILDRNDLREKTIGVKKGDKESPCEFISGPFVQSSPYYNRTVPVVEYRDLGKAEALMQRGGLEKVGEYWHLNGEPVKLRIGMKASLDQEAPDLVDQIGNQLSDGGIDNRGETISNDQWKNEVITGRAKDKYDIVIGKWSFGLDENVNDLFHSRTQYDGVRNIFDYSNPEVDAILGDFEKARRVNSAKDAYHNLHVKLAEELPYLFLWKLDTKSAWRKEVRNNLITPYYYFTVIDDWKYAKK